MMGTLGIELASLVITFAGITIAAIPMAGKVVQYLASRSKDQQRKRPCTEGV
jgi:hypothetical protein